ncbi:MAG: hypothetical protein ACM3XO_27925 [Bacteroidota bacterium]
MTLSTTTRRTTRSASLLLAIFASLFYRPVPTYALGTIDALPTLADFSRSVQNGDAKILRGVYVDNLFALPIIQQPDGSPAFVSRNDGEITQFGMAAQYGNIGLLAHNDLAGKLFTGLLTGQQVRLVYGDGKIESFVVTDVFRYQALQPNSPYSSFRNMVKSDEILTAQQVFERAYLGNRHVTFQTCIEAYGNSSWGRLFVVAIPMSDHLSLDRPGNKKYQ